MRTRTKILTVAVAALSAMALWAGAAAMAAAPRQTTTTTTSTPGVQAAVNQVTVVAAFSGGAPSSPLQITVSDPSAPASCTPVAPSTFTVTSPGTVATVNLLASTDCFATATATDGASSVTASCSGALGGAICPSPTGAEVRYPITGGSATITLTFVFPVVVSPAFTG